MRKVLLVDDHAIVRQGVALLIDQEADDLEVCGEAANADDALRKVAETGPDVVVLDITLPGRSGIDIVRELRGSHPELSILVLSMHSDVTFAERALRAGANGYVCKSDAIDTVLVAIRKVLAGEVYVTPDLAAEFMQQVVSRGRVNGSNGTPLDQFTDREFEVFRLIAQGLGTREMAAELDLSVRTIESYRQNIKTKLGLRTSADLYVYASRWAMNEE